MALRPQLISSVDSAKSKFETKDRITNKLSGNKVVKSATYS